MRIALISDIHGNTVALDAVLADLGNVGTDLVLCLGDIAAGGPDPVGAVERIDRLACPVVMGNTDADVVDTPAWWSDPAAVGAPAAATRVVEISLWAAGQLPPHLQGFLRGLPPLVNLDLGDAGTLLGFHGSPASPTDIITPATSPDELDRMLGEHLRERLLVGGHTHVPLLLRHGSSTIVNPGSVGMPFGAYGTAGDVPVLPPASYALITTQGPKINIDFREIEVDERKLAREVTSSRMPHAEWWLGLRGRPRLGGSDSRTGAARPTSG